MGLVDAVLVSGASAIVWTWTDHARESANSFHFLRGVGDYGSQKIYSSVCVVGIIHPASRHHQRPTCFVSFRHATALIDLLPAHYRRHISGYLPIGIGFRVAFRYWVNLNATA